MVKIEDPAKVKQVASDLESYFDGSGNSLTVHFNNLCEFDQTMQTYWGKESDDSKSYFQETERYLTNLQTLIKVLEQLPGILHGYATAAENEAYK